MPQTVEVRFKGIRRDFFLWPDEQDPLRLREAVVVQCERGQDLGHVHTAGGAAEAKCGGGCSGCEIGTAEKTPLVAESDAEETAAESPAAPPEATLEGPSADTASRPATLPPLRAVLRRATQTEIRAANELRRGEEDARRQAMERARQHKLDMKVCDAEWQWDRSKLTFFFTAEKRVDFRTLVRDLATQFRTRIELRQIGVRDEAARLGGVGRCGREYCCSTWLTELSPVSLALAKDQHLSLNPAQISGGCGRLLCCLKYEHEFYVAARKRFPREGKTVVAAKGTEKVIAVDIFRERVFLRGEEGSRIIPLVDLRREIDEVSATGVPVQPPPAPSTPSRGGAAQARRPAEAPPAAQPAPPSSTPPPSSSARRRRRGRRGGRGGHQGGPSSPPSPPGA